MSGLLYESHHVASILAKLTVLPQLGAECTSGQLTYPADIVEDPSLCPFIMLAASNWSEI